MGAKEAEFEKVGAAVDVTNINPMTGQAWDMMTGNVDNLFKSIMGFDARGTFGDAAGQAGQTARSFMDPYKTEMNDLLNSQITSRIRGAEGTYAGAGPSGSRQSAIARGIAEPIGQAYTQMAGMGAQLGTNMLGQRLGLDQMGYGGQLDMYGRNLQGVQGYGVPEWWQPNIVQTQEAESGWDRFMGGVGDVVTLGGAIGGAAAMGGAGGTPASGGGWPKH